MLEGTGVGGPGPHASYRSATTKPALFSTEPVCSRARHPLNRILTSSDFTFQIHGADGDTDRGRDFHATPQYPPPPLVFCRPRSPSGVQARRTTVTMQPSTVTRTHGILYAHAHAHVHVHQALQALDVVLLAMPGLAVPVRIPLAPLLRFSTPLLTSELRG